MTDRTTLQWAPGLTVHIDPDAKRAYTWDWDRDLRAGVSIDTHQIITEGAITIIGSSHAGREVTVVVSGVPDGETAGVTCRVTTDGDPAETDDRTVQFMGVPQ